MLMEDWQAFAKKLSSCRNFTEVCQLLSYYPITSASFTGALLGTIDADARIREAGRYGITGNSPSKESVALSDKGLIAQAMTARNPTLLRDLLGRAEKQLLTPESDIDELVLQDGFQSALIIPLVDNEYLYGVLGLVSVEDIEESPRFNLEYSTFQALLSMAVRAVSYRNPPKTNNQASIPPELGLRDQNVLSLLAQDKTNKEIAAELNVSVSSVKASVSHIMEVLQVGSRKEAGVKARYSQLQ